MDATGKTVRANILSLRGTRIEEWTLGVHVDEKIANQFLDGSTGELYVSEVLEAGEPQTYLLTKDNWDKSVNEHHAIGALFEDSGSVAARKSGCLVVLAFLGSGLLAVTGLFQILLLVVAN